MPNSPLIGLTGRRVAGAELAGWPEVLHPLPVDLYLSGYAQGVLEAGGVPLHIPLDVDPASLVGRLDGLLLTGGADIEPSRYGAEPVTELMTPEPERDALEFALLDRALEAGTPVLGVCRGLQILNVACGGTLEQHRPEHLRFDAPVEHLAHPISTSEGSILRHLFGETVTVNSLHHQVVDRVGAGLTVTARADDGVVEGLELGDRVVAVQWHPEMLASRAEDPSLRWLVEKARR